MASVSAILFLSTPSVWRATHCPCCRCFAPSYFYPRPPCGGRQFAAVALSVQNVFLSTPSVWRATSLSMPPARRCRFLSTPSVWRATGEFVVRVAKNKDFYPRPPCGGRPKELGVSATTVQFLSTPSVWRATAGRDNPRMEDDYFYPRPPCGGRPAKQQRCRFLQDFYPRPPCGGRQTSCRRGKQP